MSEPLCAGAQVLGQTWYKACVPLWIERYLIPICAAIVFGLVVLNPLKFDWQQRIALLVAISAFAYFLAHTVHKPKASTVAQAAPPADPRIEVLEQQIKDIQSRQQKERDEAEAIRKKQTEIRDRLSELVTEGVHFRDEWQSAIRANQSELLQRPLVGRIQKWHYQIGEYLKTVPRNSAYLARFQAGVRGPNSYPVGIFMNQAGTWDQLMSDLTTLNEFIADPDLGKS